jgi:16S rRNA (cytidine1402-2'-O)-methyltransferase
MLTLVPTPVGNLEDMTLRALSSLKSCDLVIAEDTRKSGLLLRHFGIEKPLQSFHTANEHKVVERLVERLEGGLNACLVTDAGTPGISDPGFLLVREALKKGVEVSCLPGPTAFVPALVSSGIPCERFCFEGFLPHKKGRLTRLKELEEEKRTMVFYESPHRIMKALNEFVTHFGPDRPACLSREISKMFEQHIRGSLAEIIQRCSEKEIKGEVVMIVQGKS